jgi:hypothetical protein
MKPLAFAFAATALVAASASLVTDASAQDYALPRERALGHAGTTAIGAYAGVSHASHTSTINGSTEPYTYENTGARLSGVVDHFVLDHVSIGLGAGFGYFGGKFGPPEKGIETNSIEGTFSGRIGAYLPLGDRVALWPIARVNYTFGSVSNEPQSGGGLVMINSSTRSELSLALDAQLIFHVSARYFIRLTPWSGQLSW